MHSVRRFATTAKIAAMSECNNTKINYSVKAMTLSTFTYLDNSVR